MAEIGSCMYSLAQFSAHPAFQQESKAKICQMRETGGQKQATARYFVNRLNKCKPVKKNLRNLKSSLFKDYVPAKFMFFVHWVKTCLANFPESVN